MLQRALKLVKAYLNDRKPARKTFVCISCGAPVQELFKKVGSVLKISECQKCDQIADKYIEFETIIILIDLVLLAKPAYRHVIFNTESKNLWKLSVIMVLLESYCVWVERFTGKGSGHQVFELEKAFYFSALEVLLSNLCLYLLMGVFSRGVGSALNLLRALILASIPNFFFLPIMIWKANTTATQVAIHLTLVVGYFITSLVTAHSVISYSSKLASFSIILLALGLTTYCLTEFDPILWNLFF